MSNSSEEVQDLVPDFDLSADFLCRWAGETPICLVAIKEGVKTEAKIFGPGDIARLKGWIENFNRRGYGTYFTVNQVRDDLSDQKPKKSEIDSALGLHVDVDQLDDSTFEKILRFVPNPTAMLNSGGGYQAFWRFDETVTDFEHVEALNKSIAKQLGGDACHNIDRLMRVPGTINWPNARKRKAGRKPVVARLLADETDFARRYKLSDFQKIGLAGSLALSREESVVPDHIPVLAVGDLGFALPARLSELIRSGDDPERPRTGDNPRHPSRSETVFAAAIGLARLNATRDQIAGLLLNADYGISESIFDKPNPRAYAWRQAHQAVSIVWAEWPDTYRSGAPKPSLANALLGLTLMQIVLEYDLFRNRIIIGGHDLQDFQGEVTDNSVALLRKLFLDVHGFDPGKTHLIDAVQTLSLEHRFHPICDYLEGLQWDGIPRLETFLIDCFGAKDTPLNRHVGKLMMVAAVRRVRRPGCKFDMMVVLEGAQGTGKSTAIVILAGKGNFSDQHLIGLDDKAQMEALEGVWLFEVAELDGMSRAEVSKIKAFISRTEDRARRPYAVYKSLFPRQCILIGTTNDAFYLKDSTGNRRFLPVKTGKIDLEALRRERDQLWAEAAKLEAGGFSIELPKELWEAAADEQRERLQEDPWIDILSKVEGFVRDGVERVSTEQLFGEDCLGIPPAQRQPFHPKRIAAAMRELGWDGPKKIRATPGDPPVRGYARPTDKPDNVDM